MGELALSNPSINVYSITEWNVSTLLMYEEIRNTVSQPQTEFVFRARIVLCSTFDPMTLHVERARQGWATTSHASRSPILWGEDTPSSSWIEHLSLPTFERRRNRETFQFKKQSWAQFLWLSSCLPPNFSCISCVPVTRAQALEGKVIRPFIG